MDGDPTLGAVRAKPGQFSEPMINDAIWPACSAGRMGIRRPGMLSFFGDRAMALLPRAGPRLTMRRPRPGRGPLVTLR
jgi:hypothetical protein